MHLTHQVFIYSAEVKIVQAIISAFCSVCGVRRGTPKFHKKKGFHTWVNPCGHQDSFEDLMLEIECQCARPGCVIMFSETHFPFCGSECADTACVPAQGSSTFEG